MSCATALPQKQLTLYTNTTVVQREWVTEWLPAIALSRFGAVMNIQLLTGNFRIRMRYQLAPVRPEGATSTTAIGSYVSSDGFHSFQQALTVNSGLMIRFGVEYSLGSGSAGGALVTVQPSVVQCGRLLGGDTVKIHPGLMTSTDINFFPVTPWSPILGLANIGAGVILADNESNYLQWALAARSAVDPKAPNSWQLLSSWFTPDSTHAEVYTGVFAPSALNPTTNAFFQTGLAVRKRDGAAGNPRATLSATVAVRT